MLARCLQDHAESCLYTGNQWNPGTPSTCSQPADKTDPRNTKALCENDPTGLIWDSGQCMRLLNDKTDIISCEKTPNGYTYHPNVSAADAMCKDKDNNVVSNLPSAQLTAANCAGVATGFSWATAACNDPSFKTRSGCLKTGFVWRLPYRVYAEWCGARTATQVHEYKRKLYGMWLRISLDHCRCKQSLHKYRHLLPFTEAAKK